MSLSDHLSQLAGALEQARTKIGEKQAELDKLRSQRNVIARAKPHADDITNSLVRAIDAQARSFEADLKSKLSSIFVRAEDAADSVIRTPVNILAFDTAAPDPVKLAARRARGEFDPLHPGALAFLLRDRLADEIPALVDRLCPEASKGMRSTDREQKLDALDAEISALKAEIAALNEELAGARRLTWGAGL
ncbi:MAG: hypothetical protein NTX28_06310 [Novosphingobium sp.]|nr:hypothetical protein [Novosphingobium sp.]